LKVTAIADTEKDPIPSFQETHHSLPNNLSWKRSKPIELALNCLGPSLCVLLFPSVDQELEEEEGWTDELESHFILK
jgi:hypothetical protein